MATSSDPEFTIIHIPDFHIFGLQIVCSSGAGAVGGCVFWSHRIVLAAVSPLFLKPLLLGSERDDGNSVLTLHLPQVAPAHVRLVLDYVYTGAMYLRADQGKKEPARERPFNLAVEREDSQAHAWLS